MKWTDTQWFTTSDYGGGSSGATQVVDVGYLGTSSAPWHEEDATAGAGESSETGSGAETGSDAAADSVDDSIVTSPDGGSGSTPSITIGIDYWLRVETGEVLTDEVAGPLSLESV